MGKIKGFIKSVTKRKNMPEHVDSGRRKMLAITGALLASAAIDAEGRKINDSLAYIENKQIPKRKTAIVPSGAVSIGHFTKHCTRCQKCVEACPSKVLRPSTDMTSFMMPMMSYEQGYCSTECTHCADVCPDGAILPITKAEKSSTQIGHAVWIQQNCIAANGNKACDTCAKVCPVGAITMVTTNDDKMAPAVNTAHCIGCGACEHACTAYPFTAIYVEGHEIHQTI